MPNARRRAGNPVGDNELTSLFDCYRTATGIGLAVSGGADSTALMVLSARWRALTGAEVPLHVLTVDHGLRPEAAAETAAVAELAGELGLPVHVLTWTGPVPDSDLQAKARGIRFRLMADRVRTLGLSHLALAHHQDDQAETFMMRLARGSGVVGLAAMRTCTDIEGIGLLRPLLDLPRERLAASLRSSGHTWIEDRTNTDRRHARVRWRQLMPALADEGLDAPRLAATARRMARAADLAATLVGDLIRVHGELYHLGPARIAAVPLVGAHPEIALRTLAELICHVSGADYAPRLAKLESLHRALACDRPGAVKRTLGGTVIERTKEDVWFYREPGRSGLPSIPLNPRKPVIWDDTVVVAATADAPSGLVVRALGRDGLARIDWAANAPGRVFYNCVSVWDTDGPAHAPGVNWTRADCHWSVRFTRSRVFAGD